MRQITTIALASLASLAIAGASQAAVWGGFGVLPGVLRPTNLVVQNQTAASNATSSLAVTLCTGAVQYPPFVVVSATTCVANTPNYQIIMDVLSPTQTKVSIIALSATCAIKSISFGTPNSQCAFDLTNPNPGTVGSLQGANPLATGLTGAWTSTIRFDNAVNIFGAAAVGDLYSRMTVNFSSCFDVGDVCTFTVDTDKIN